MIVQDFTARQLTAIFSPKVMTSQFNTTKASSVNYVVLLTV